MNLTSVYILNPALKPNKHHPIEEDYQDAKLLFYYPETIQLNDKRSHVGISEGVVQFFSLFAETKGYMVINSQNYTHVMKEVEPNHWLNMIFFHKELFDPEEEDLEAKQRTKFPQIEDSFYEAIISCSYELFCLFHGSFAKLFAEKSREDAHLLLTDFFLRYASEFINTPALDFFPWNFNGFCYCPIDKKIFLRTQLYLNRIKEKFPFVKHTMLLYYNYMIFHDLPVHFAKLLHSYITGVTEKRARTRPKILSYDTSCVAGAKAKKEGEKALRPTAGLGSSAAATAEKAETVQIGVEPLSPAFKIFPFDGADKNGFLVGPAVGLPGQDTYVFMPRVYIGEERYRMMILYMVGLMTVLLIDDKDEICADNKLLTKLNMHVKRKAQDLCTKSLTTAVKMTEELPETHVYYYFNYVNNAVRLSPMMSNELLRKLDVAVVLNNMHDSLTLKSRGMLAKEESTMCAYKMNAYWIVMFKILDREICVLFPVSVPMERIEEERNRFRELYFGSIFVL